MLTLVNRGSAQNAGDGDPAWTFTDKINKTFGGYYAAMNYGCVGDTSTDDRTALNTLANTTIPSGTPTTGTILFAPNTYRISSNITFPAGVALNFMRGAKLSIDAGVTVTINGDVIAPRSQIFDVSGAGSTVTFASSNDVETNPIWFGADPTYATDSTTGFQKCFASGTQRVYISAGQYDIRGTISFTGTRVQVRGAALNTLLYFNPSTDSIPLFSSTNDDNVTFRDFYCYLNNSFVKSQIVCFDFATANVSALLFEGVVIDGFNRYGIKLDSATYLKIDRCRFANIHSDTATPAEAIRCTTFCNSASILRSRFALNDKEMRLVSMNSLTIQDCSFERTGVGGTTTVNYGIEISGGAAVSFRSNYVEGPVPGAGYAFVVFDTVNGVDVSGTDFSGEWAGVAVTDRMVSFINCRGVQVRNNRFIQIISYFVEAVSQVHVVRCYDNAFSDNAVELSTYNGVMALMNGAAKIELDNFHHTLTLDLASIANGGALTSADVPITGCLLGDHVSVSSSIALAGLSVSASVNSNGNARLTAVNNTGGAVDLASCDWYFKIRKLDL